MGVSEDDVNITLEKVTMLFGYLHEKDVFEKSIINSIWQSGFCLEKQLL